MRTRTLSQMICCRFSQQSIGLIPRNNSLILFLPSRRRPTMRLTRYEHKTVIDHLLSDAFDEDRLVWDRSKMKQDKYTHTPISKRVCLHLIQLINEDY